MAKMKNFSDPEKSTACPDKTFTDKLTVLGGKEAIDLYYFGPAHTNGDRSWCSAAADDACRRHLRGKGTPFIDRNNGGNGVKYGETLAKAAAGIKNVDTVIPGQRGHDVGRLPRIRRVQQRVPDRHAGGD